MATKRRDNRGRNLKDGEDQMPDGRYRFRYLDKSGKRQALYSWRLVPTDRAPAGKRDGTCLRDKEEELANDRRDGIDGKQARAVILNEMFDLYISGKTELKQSTRSNYLYMYRNYIAEDIGKRQLSNIKYSTVKAFYNHLINELGFKPNSMEIIHTILHPVFTLAVRDGYIRTNPTDGVMAEIKKSHSWEKPKRHALTEDQQTLFIEFLRQSEIYNHWLPMITVFLGTGCRVGEIIGLRWKDCDFIHGTISINHNLIYRVHRGNGEAEHCEWHITTPKTTAGCRTIPMLDEVREALLTVREWQLSGEPCTDTIDGYTNFIFCNRYGNVYTPHSINLALERIRLACNEWEAARAAAEHRQPVIVPHFSVHNLRHTFCTRFCENETNVKVIQEIMGHADISTTMNIYAEATESKKQQSFANLQGKIKIG
jgi:integrase